MAFIPKPPYQRVHFLSHGGTASVRRHLVQAPARLVHPVEREQQDGAYLIDGFYQFVVG